MLFPVCVYVYSVGYFTSVERSYSVRLFVLCVLAIVVMALLSCRKVETVSVLEMHVHTLLMSVHMRLVLVWALQLHEMCWMGKGWMGIVLICG